MFGRRPPQNTRTYGRKSVPPRRERDGFFSRRSAPGNTRSQRPVPVKTPSRISSWDWGRFRVWTIGVFFSLLWLTLWGRAYYLQIIMGPEYAAMAKRQHTAREVVQGTRGNILDRNGNVIARSVECSSVWANPSAVKNKRESAAKLAEALKMPRDRLEKLLSEDRRFVWLARKVDFRTAEAIKEMGLAGIHLEVETERAYPYKHLAGQLLGFVDIDDKGIEGLEKSFEHELAGRVVTRVVERDAAGRRLTPPGSGVFMDLRGRDVRLTIDTQVQFFAEEALQEHVTKFGARWGGCIVVDVPTGEVLAWAQYPFFDPNNVGATPPADRRNRLAMDALEQGSTIKSFLVAAALQEGVVTPSTEINCERGVWRLGKAVLHDTHPYSRLSVQKVLHVSSNIGVAKIGLMLGAERYRAYLQALGFGERTGLPLAGEVKGILRPASRWAEIDLATASFGQSFSATLAQVAGAYLCLANDGVMQRLRLVMDDSVECRVGPPGAGGFNEDGTGRRVFSTETMHMVREMLREVVEEEGGTGKHARIPGLVVGGKTGTAQKADKKGAYGEGRVGSFVGMLPIEKPRYLVCVLLDEPTAVQYGGVIAAPVFRHVALHTMAYHGLLPESDDPAVQAAAKKAGDRPAAGTVLTEAAFESAPRSLAGNAVPRVVGLGIRSAVEVFAREGIMPTIKGRGGFVVRQSPEPGKAWPEGKKECTLWLEERAS